VGGFFTAASFMCCKDIAFASADDVTSTSTRRLRSTVNRRRLISKDDNIVDVLSGLDRVQVVGPLGFDIEAEEEGGAGVLLADPSSVSVDSTTLMLHLDEMTSAVTSNTVLHFPERSLIHEQVDASKITFLASSPSSTTRDLTVVSVNTNSGEVHGLQRHGESGTIRQISPKDNTNPTLQLRSASMSSEPRKFNDHDDHLHRHMADASSNPHDDTDHGHHHYNHDEGEHHRTRHLVDTSNLRSAATESTHKGFQINLIVDIDRQLIQQNGGLERAIEYVNFIVSTTNIVLKNEFDLHLNVVQISETAIFNKMDDGSTIRDALKLMRETYHGTVGKYEGAHLRHALLGKDLGGGIAFTDTVCDSSWGFGISSGMRGEIGNMDLYDVFVFAHELGHNLGSGHPFDEEYSPPVDTCQLNNCPEGLPLNASSTLMSYCGHFCGGMSNTAFTYGGVWDQISPRGNLTSWLQNPALVESPISTDAQRISHSIWTKLVENEECIGKRDPLSFSSLSAIFMVDPEDEETTVAASLASNVTTTIFEPTKSPSPSQNPSASLSPTVTSVPSSTPTWTSKPTISPSSSPSNYPTGLPSITSSENPSNMPSSNPTNGVHSISPLKQCGSRCKRTNGYMFNVKLGTNAANDIIINSISFLHKAPSVHRVIRVYTIDEGYKGKEESMESWTEIASDRAPKRNNFVSTITLDPPLRIKVDETVGFYLQMEENILIAGKFGKTETRDGNAVELQYGMAVINGLFTKNYSWSGSVEYEIVDN